MRKILVFVVLLSAFSAIAREKLVWRGEDPHWNKFQTSYHGWHFRLVTNGVYTFFAKKEGETTANQLYSIGRFTPKSIVNYRKGTISLWVGQNENGREVYITVRRERIVEIWD